MVQSLTRHLGGKPAEVASTMKRGTARERVEHEVLRLDRARRRRARVWPSTIDEGDFSITKLRASFVALRDAEWDASAIAGGPDPDLASRIASLTVEPMEGDPSPEYASAVVDSLRGFVLQGAQRRASRATPETEPDDRCRI